MMIGGGSWEEERERERNIRGALRSSVIVILDRENERLPLFRGERMKVSERHPSWLFLRLLYLAWDRKALKVRWRTSAPSP